jgi:uncharacterized protein (DUF58 family)
MTGNKPTPQYAVWLFVAATFVFAVPVIVFQGSAEWWVTVLSLAVGMLLVVLGGVQLGREIRERRGDPPARR